MCVRAQGGYHTAASMGSVPMAPTYKWPAFPSQTKENRAWHRSPRWPHGRLQCKELQAQVPVGRGCGGRNGVGRAARRRKPRHHVWVRFFYPIPTIEYGGGGYLMPPGHTYIPPPSFITSTPDIPTPPVFEPIFHDTQCQNRVFFPAFGGIPTYPPQPIHVSWEIPYLPIPPPPVLDDTRVVKESNPVSYDCTRCIFAENRLGHAFL